MARRKSHSRNIKLQGFADILVYDARKKRVIGKRAIKNFVSNVGLGQYVAELVCPWNSDGGEAAHQYVGPTPYYWLRRPNGEVADIQTAAPSHNPTYDQFGIITVRDNINGLVYAAVGTSTDAADYSATALLYEDTTGRKAVSTGTSALGTSIFGWSYQTDELVGVTMGEVGLLDNPRTDTDYPGRIYCRATYPHTLKTADMQILFTYYLRWQTG
jgi:hypothetical protein